MIQRTTLRAAAAGLLGSGKILKLKTFAGIAAFLFIFATVLPAEVYQYTGVAYDSVTGSAYSASDLVTGTFTLSDPLAMSATGFDATGTLTSWTINDGVNTLCDTCSGALLPSLFFDTDPMGNIIGWYFDATSTGSGSGVQVSSSNTSYDHAVDGDSVSTGTSTSAGSWQDTTTPEPGTLGMMIAGSLLLFGTIRRRAGKASRQT